ncbi:serine/threonine-protein kinase PBL34-like [Salvia splendens]|uniref:serine/threonine-protein kinase PBL34-like n=1 Tax=Salvia splendens TaxID=180675 RepID=UPI001C270FE6|nr:serine/threonine-protein kinase PBL34-like [Salvia splendens]
MDSFVARSCSTRRCTPLMLGGVVIAFDAFKTHDIDEFKKIISDVLNREQTFEEVRTITFLGALDRVLHPMGFKIQVEHKTFVGAHGRAIEEDVSRKLEQYVSALQSSAVECEEKGVEIQVKIIVGAPLIDVIVEEISSLRATWTILDRKLKKETRSCYLKNLSCKVAQVRDNLCLEILRPYNIDTGYRNTKHKLIYSLGKAVPLPPTQEDESDMTSTRSLPITPMIRSRNPNNCLMAPPMTNSEEKLVSSDDESDTSPHQESQVYAGEIEIGEEDKHDGSRQVENEDDDVDLSYSEMKIEAGEYSSDTSPEDNDPKEENKAGDEVDDEIQECSNVSDQPFPCDSEKTNACLESLRSSYSLVQTATDDFSFDKFLGEGGHEVEYKGKLSDSKEESKAGEEVEDEIQERSDKPFPRDSKKTNACLDPLGCSYSIVQSATDDFSFDNFIGEGGYGIVYKGKLSDGQLVAVKVQKETKPQTSAEFLAEVSPLSAARHANIVPLLGYCSKGNLRILIYEYIHNKSLEWHLFDNAAGVLEWSQRYAIAVGAAKGLRFLHECCESPIVHCNVRPSNVMLTQDLIPMLGDFGLAKYSTSKFDKQRNFLGNLGYVAPEGSIGCVKADVYAFGIVLAQLVSGRKAVDAVPGDQQQSIREWALSLIESLALDDLVDPRLGAAYCTYELYNMARAAYSCLQTAPLSRPTLTEIVCILEGENDHLRHVSSNLYPMIIRAEDCSLLIR